MSFPIKPVGTKLIILPIERKDEELSSGIVVSKSVNAELSEGKIVSVSNELNGKYSLGDIILYPSKKGVGQIISGIPHLWLDAEPTLKEIWGKVNE